MASRSPLALKPAWDRPVAAPPPGVALRGEAKAEARPRGYFDDPEVARWDALAQEAAEPNPFFESWYLLPSLDALDGAESVRLLCVELAGQLIGLLPIVRERSYYGRPLPHWRTWLHSNAFCGVPLVAAGAETVFWRAVLAWADGAGRAPLFLHLAELPLHGRVHAALVDELGRGARPSKLVHRYERAMLRSGLSPADYFEASVNAKRRKELRRQEKRLAEQGRLVIERRRGAEGLERWIEEFLALEHAGWKGAEGSALASTHATQALFRGAIHGAAERGRLERLTLRLDGRAIAILVTFLSSPGAFGYKTAYDEAYARASPGVMLQRAFLDLLEEREFAWCDSCASPNHAMIDHFWRERRPIGRINVAVGGAARQTLFKAISRFETGPTSGIIE